MSLPTTLLHYESELDALERAATAVKGIRIGFDTYEMAWRYRFRIHKARALMREKNKEIYQPGDALYGRSPYDNITCPIRQDVEDKWWIYLEKNINIPGIVESLDDKLEGDLP